jgi:hypothetical protein
MSRDMAEEDGRSDEEDDDETVHLENDVREVIANDPEDLEGDALGDGWDVDDNGQHLPGLRVSLTPTETRSTTASSFPAQDPPTPEIAALASHTSDNQPFMLDGPATHIGRKRKARDLQAILEVCTCGQAVTDNKITSGGSVIKCKSTGCETGWVSQKISRKQTHRLLKGYLVPSAMC